MADKTERGEVEEEPVDIFEDDLSEETWELYRNQAIAEGKAQVQSLSGATITKAEYTDHGIALELSDGRIAEFFGFKGVKTATPEEHSGQN